MGLSFWGGSRREQYFPLVAACSIQAGFATGYGLLSGKLFAHSPSLMASRTFPYNSFTSVAPMPNSSPTLIKRSSSFDSPARFRW